MTDHVDMKPVLSFLSAIQKNNNKPWFEEHRPAYEKARTQFEDLIDELIMGFSPVEDLGGITAKDCVMRIYRDIRFSNDKRPYKTHVGMQFGHGGGGKDVHAPGYYLQLEPGECFVCGGIWRPDRIGLMKIREKIVSQPDLWAKVTRGLTLSDEDKLSRPPRGFPSEHRHLEDLKRKSIFALIDLSEQQVCGARFMGEFEKSVGKMAPLVEFLARAMEMKW